MDVHALDQAVRVWVVDHRHERLNPIMLGLTIIGGGGLVWSLIAIVLVAVRRATLHDLIRVVLAVALATGISDYVLKPIIHRPRPFLVVSGPAVIGHAPHDSSFPSGHAAAAVAGALTLARASPTGQLAWWLLAAGIAYSRVYLGVHYPSDVAGSVAIGAICGALVIAAIKRIQVPKHQAP